MSRFSIEKTRPWLLIALGCLVMTFAMNVFLIPFKLAPGGISGLSTVVYYVFNKVIPVGVLMLVFNIPLFLGGFKSKGKGFVIRSLFGAILLSVMVDITAPFTENLVNDYLIRFDSSMAVPDLLLNALVGGLIMGFGLGMVLKEGATTGGTDLAAALLKKVFPRRSLGELLLILDGCVILLATLVFRSVKLGLYASISLYISTKTIDTYIEGFHFAKSLMIISEKSEEISRRLMMDVDRGVTGLKGIGMYSGADKTVLLCVIKKQEMPTVKEIVKQCDPNAFVFLSDVREVLGEGFEPLHPEEK
ncbi:MAG: YitT family protein [Clostridiaceae bacterium]|jgi:uncharacterized membrane-anchored protein YitT (DUF2179 family)|nr:YitT family protein [Bacillota bacterium]NLI38718.1 YitT family protein [Clostridiaceae bacterium]